MWNGVIPVVLKYLSPMVAGEMRIAVLNMIRGLMKFQRTCHELIMANGVVDFIDYTVITWMAFAKCSADRLTTIADYCERLR